MLKIKTACFFVFQALHHEPVELPSVLADVTDAADGAARVGASLARGDSTALNSAPASVKRRRTSATIGTDTWHTPCAIRQQKF
jgi:hypothetical protein